MKKILLTLILIAAAASSFADAEANARLYSFGLTSCQATAKFVSGYSEWLGNLKKIVDQDIKLHPENSVASNQILRGKNEKSKDILYEQLEKVNAGLRGSSDVKGLAKDLGDLVMRQAEILAIGEPGMSRAYYQRSLDAFCTESMLSILSKLP